MRLLVGDVFERLAELDDHSVDLIVTSPPFLALRSYLPPGHPDKAKEIGSEGTPAAFIDVMLRLTAEFRRVLAPHGSICVELGDTFSGSGGAGGDYGPDGLRAGQAKFRQGLTTFKDNRGNPAGMRDTTFGGANTRTGKGAGWPLAKSMCGIPHAYKLSLEYGWNVLDRHADDSPAGRWRVRNYICWGRPNPPVGSLGKRDPVRNTGDQRFRVATSYITVACVGTSRFFDLDAVRTEHKHWDGTGDEPGSASRAKAHDIRNRERAKVGNSSESPSDGLSNPAGAPPLDWHTDQHPEDGDWLWKLPTAPYTGAHYATFPETLPKRLILAMCPQRVCQTCGRPSERIVGFSKEYAEHRTRSSEAGTDLRERRRTEGMRTDARNGERMDAQHETLGWTDCGHNDWRPGVVLDPFAGSGTTLAVAVGCGRDAIGIDLDERNIDLCRQRIGMFLDVEHPEPEPVMVGPEQMAMML